jgi:hypothetical protein
VPETKRHSQIKCRFSNYLPAQHVENAELRFWDLNGKRHPVLMALIAAVLILVSDGLGVTAILLACWVYLATFLAVKGLGGGSCCTP